MAGMTSRRTDTSQPQSAEAQPQGSVLRLRGRFLLLLLPALAAGEPVAAQQAELEFFE